MVRSGTNSFHGNLWEFLRNDKLAANDWFNNLYGSPRSILRYNQFGGTVGGPIKRNKTFFFFDYESIRTKSPGTATVGVPSAAERKGDFGEICAPGFDPNGMCKDPEGQLWDPYTGVYDASRGGPVRSAYIPYNNLANYQSPGSSVLNGTGYQLPATPGNLIDPVSAKLMQLYPMPNINVGSPSYNRYANFFDAFSNPDTISKFGIKIDHSFSEKDRLSGRFTRRTEHSTGTNVYNSPADPFSEGLQTWNAYQGVINYTHVFNPRTLLNVSLGYIANPVKSGLGVLDTMYPSFDITKDLGFPGYMEASGLRAVPGISVSNYARGYLSMGSVPWGFFWQTPETHHLLVSLSRLEGRHDLKFGWEGRLRRVSFLQPNSATGTFSFGYESTSQFPRTGGGDAFASLLMGVGDGGSYEIPDRPATQNFQYAGYIQDNWRATDKLTLNVGLRYDISLPRTERFNHMNYLDPNAVSPLQVPGLPTLHGGLVYADPSHRNVTGLDYKNFGPRFGFAYTLRPKFVIRGGYGLFYDPPRNGVAGTVASGFQGFSQTTPQITTFQNDGVIPWGRLSDPFPGTGPNLPIFNSQGLLSFVGDSVQAPIRSIHATPYEQSWNVGIQRQLPLNTVVDASYVGMKGTHLYFGGAEQLNHLPEISGYSPAQIAGLNEYVSNPFYGIIKTGALSGPTVQAYQLQLPYPQFTGFSVDSLPAANSIYNSFQLRAEKRLSRGLQFLVSYTLSKSIDDASVQGLTSWLGGAASLQDPNNRRLERSLSQFDATHVFNISYVWDIPIGRGQLIGRNWNPWLNGFLGGWKTNGIWQFASGQPLGLSLATGQSLPTYGAQRPDLLGPLQKAGGSDGQWVNQYFANPNVAVAPPPFALGTAPRTLPNLRGPGIDIANLSLFKEFSMARFREGMRLEYRAEAFNAFNHPHFCAPDTNVNDGTFGQIFSTCTAPRQVQMALKFYF
ncbi:MAG: TonB-dependent receptor [Bryobacteraceae bacterium]